MHRIATLCAIVLISALFLARVFYARAEANDNLYDSDPDNAWNHLTATLFIRTAPDGTEYGLDTLDPLYWARTKHLLEGDSLAAADRALDEFLDQHSEQLDPNPLKHAILQRDLWALFDWAATRNRFEQVPVDQPGVTALTSRLAAVIQRLALTKSQINSLPDNYSDTLASKAFPETFDPAHPDAGFLPPDLFQKDGPWVCVDIQHASLPAPYHTQQFGGRSIFLIFINLPNGRDQTLAYINKLDHFPEPWIFDQQRMVEIFRAQPQALPAAMPHRFSALQGPWVNPALPQFPVGTQFALVRQTMLIDSAGELVPTHLTECVQIRRYQAIDPAHTLGNEQLLFEFDLSRANLFAGKAGGLRPVAKYEKGFTLLASNGIDPFENQGNQPGQAPLMNCMGCHDGAGIHSVLSHSQLFATHSLIPPEYQDSDPSRLDQLTAGWKQDQFSWGLLKGLLPHAN